MLLFSERNYGLFKTDGTISYDIGFHGLDSSSADSLCLSPKDESLHDSSKIAAFDFDGCLANTSVRRVGPDAWSLMYPSILAKLQSLYNDGYKLVIFTNESNIERCLCISHIF
ncbi:polynucleotide 3'-phosphatase ZDP-like [Humulus lupulus]|uniref:polynucleotide 3'-phosphatase ZDP-like n=1 Tax=Humulus lupulus TaxID=3486 RepID=UPI002B416099|nr:polynucleotide 3'-phosphatase ZDP-like [Humulus lupulus]XP_062088309.1 polynucleotide 3'-phosphatase ZDP-like [Humulus lupulus]